MGGNNLEQGLQALKNSRQALKEADEAFREATEALHEFWKVMNKWQELLRDKSVTALEVSESRVTRLGKAVQWLGKVQKAMRKEVDLKVSEILFGASSAAENARAVLEETERAMGDFKNEVRDVALRSMKTLRTSEFALKRLTTAMNETRRYKDLLRRARKDAETKIVEEEAYRNHQDEEPLKDKEEALKSAAKNFKNLSKMTEDARQHMEDLTIETAILKDSQRMAPEFFSDLRSGGRREGLRFQEGVQDSLRALEAKLEIFRAAWRTLNTRGDRMERPFIELYMIFLRQQENISQLTREQCKFEIDRDTREEFRKTPVESFPQIDRGMEPEFPLDGRLLKHGGRNSDGWRARRSHEYPKLFPDDKVSENPTSRQQNLSGQPEN
ncbi:uncharacterized protein LOC100902509 [Galendromus occidentalis]|uniref:Uncharacterized protein LOC100902509 n=1 Tax=Galendromus occidentalis TaxID=34638 RepID=A0AAJ6VYZ0_9ACAR|nr:uncharacterized protein LOC100902509 [Galendromus occidentalis]